MPEPVIAVVPGKPVMFALIQFIDHHVLDFFDAHTPAKTIAAFLNPANNKTDLRIGKPVCLCHLCVCRFDGVLDFPIIERDFTAVPLDDFQLMSSSICFCASISRSSQSLPRYL